MFFSYPDEPELLFSLRLRGLIKGFFYFYYAKNACNTVVLSISQTLMFRSIVGAIGARYNLLQYHS